MLNSGGLKTVTHISNIYCRYNQPLLLFFCSSFTTNVEYFSFFSQVGFSFLYDRSQCRTHTVPAINELECGQLVALVLLTGTFPMMDGRLLRSPTVGRGIIYPLSPRVWGIGGGGVVTEGDLLGLLGLLDAAWV